MREAMVESIGRWTVGKTDCLTAISSLNFFRREKPMPPSTCLVEASVVLVVQGEKQMLAGGEAYPYNINRFLITSLDIPANSQVVTASADHPCLGLAFKLDLRTIRRMSCRKHWKPISGCTGSMMQAPSTISRSRYFIKNLPGISLL